MDFLSAIFYVFATILVLAGLRVITARNPVHAALFLVLAFFSAAAIWMLLEAEFLSLALVLVYVGAVMVLFLFVVMMLDVNFDTLREGFWRHLPVGLLVAGAMVLEMVLVLSAEGFRGAPSPEAHGFDYSNTRELGAVLYTQYLYAFELAAVLLLVAIVAAIALTLRRREGVKRNDVGEQVKVRREDRVRVLQLAPEAPVGAQPDAAPAGEGAP
ncbi:MAG: NADH-quinone oxidoreductase subunit J [Burkholderiales bacterium]|jgi:NADH-quinone oxidoreductase subunit J|nr:NADH-quinone oxidoreductase subunit J [Betaproteobacteria bacterium]